MEIFNSKKLISALRLTALLLTAGSAIELESRGGWGAGLGGFAAGAFVGSALSSNRGRDYYYPVPVQQQPTVYYLDEDGNQFSYGPNGETIYVVGQPANSAPVVIRPTKKRKKQAATAATVNNQEEIQMLQNQVQQLQTQIDQLTTDTTELIEDETAESAGISAKKKATKKST